MSIKRSKQRGSGSGRRDYADEHPGFGKPPEPEKTWEEHMAGQPDESFLPYVITSRFEKGALIQHAKFGKGVVISVEGTRVEVLFSDGKKKLGHGAAPTQ
jgi:hypothetical protein